MRVERADVFVIETVRFHFYVNYKLGSELWGKSSYICEESDVTLDPPLKECSFSFRKCKRKLRWLSFLSLLNLALPFLLYIHAFLYIRVKTPIPTKTPSLCLLVEAVSEFSRCLIRARNSLVSWAVFSWNGNLFLPFLKCSKNALEMLELLWSCKMLTNLLSCFYNMLGPDKTL